jgi:hypothetical protein
MKTLLALFLTLFTLPAMAQDSFLLFSKGHWKVTYQVTSSGIPYCVAEVAGDGVYFSLDVGKSTLDAFYISDFLDLGPDTIKGEVNLQIDGRDTWVTPGSGSEDVIRMFGLKTEFLNQLQDGRRLYIDVGRDGNWDAWFSLAGSAAALNALVDCKYKL